MDSPTLDRIERIEEREDRTGRIRTATVTLWVVQCNGTLIGEYRTKREARAAITKATGSRDGQV